jgi:hypothetical protein
MEISGDDAGLRAEHSRSGTPNSGRADPRRTETTTPIAKTMARPDPKPRDTGPNDDHFVDLHGVTLAEVESRLEEALRHAFRARVKRVVFVHGAGNHSDTGESPLAASVRASLKRLLDTPRSVVNRLEFGEESKELGGNRGCVRATISLELSRDDVAFRPRASARAAPNVLDKKRAVRRAPESLSDRERAAIDAAEEALRRKFGGPGLDGSYRAAREKDGEWPGQR